LPNLQIVARGQELTMRIAQIAPLMESVPPKRYGGTERIVSYLTEELVRAGHEVTLFASADSLTRADLRPMCEMGLRLAPSPKDPIASHLLMLEEVRRGALDFDIIHVHVDLLHYALLRDHAALSLTTMHGRLDLPLLVRMHELFDEFPLVSISEHQRNPIPDANWVGTVHHGLPLNLLPFSAKDDGYLAFLGRISPEKRPDRAIEIAVRAGAPLKIAAKIDPADIEYWEQKIEPLVNAAPNVEFIGEIDEREKALFLGGARALLFPIDWPEPFGLVMIEALACGVPVIAYQHGSVPEVIEDGVTGFLVNSIDEAVKRVDDVKNLDRAAIRRTFERRFSAERMASNYVAIYQRMMALGKPKSRIQAVNGLYNATF
jgi:glycosyltransferase involved in cell wall biosynthesis